MTRAIAKINERELTRGAGKSWHSDYADSAYIFIGNLDFRLSEGDVLTIFSQYESDKCKILMLTSEYIYIYIPQCDVL